VGFNTKIDTLGFNCSFMDKKANAAECLSTQMMIFVLGFEGLKFGLELWSQPQWVGVRQMQT
jgi:hypothetical protein